MTASQDGRYVSVQVGAHSVFDEGPQHVVEHLKRTCRATALDVYASSGHHHAPWYQASGQTIIKRFVDHGADLSGAPPEPITTVWFKSDGRHYERPELAPDEPGLGYSGRDVFEELAEPAARAGVAINARFCDWGNVLPYVPGMMDWAIVDADGVRKPFLCPNNPGFQRWQRNLMEDIFRPRPYLAGLNFGLERGTPLMAALKGDGKADCFCAHCCALGERKGIRIDRARAGFAELADWAAATRGQERPVDGAFSTFFRALRDYPEVLAWDKQMTDGWFTLCRDMYATVKAIDPQKKVGWHIFQHLSFNPLFRSIFDLAKMAPFSDWIKPVLYHNCAGERMKGWFMNEAGRTLFADLPRDLALRAAYAMLGYEGCELPDWAEMARGHIRGFGPDWIAREVKRCIAGAAGTPIYAGIGLDVVSPDGEPCTPENVYAVTRAALEAGAAGIVVSREYDEMQTAHLEAVGRAVGERAGTSQRSV
jgi:hypothetical protein